MEVVDTGAAGRDAAADRVGWGAGWAMARRIGRDGVRARELHTACVGPRRGGPVRMDVAFGEGWARGEGAACIGHGRGSCIDGCCASGHPGTSCPVKKTMKQPVYIIAHYKRKMKTIYQISN